MGTPVKGLSPGGGMGWWAGRVGTTVVGVTGGGR